MPKQIAIAELKIDNKQLLSSLQATKKSIEELSATQKTLKDNNDTTSQSFIQNEASLKSLKQEYNAQVKVLQSVTSANKNLNSELDKEIKGVDEAKANNAALIKIRNQVNATTDEGAKQITAINKKIDENNKVINTNSSVLEKQKQQIGDYGKGLVATNPILSQMSTTLTAVRDGLIAKNAAMKASETATGGASKALRVFKLALVSTGIGAIVVVLGSLISYLSTTQAGIDKVTSVTRPLQAIFQSLIGVLQTVGEKLFNAFSNPKQALTDLVDGIKNNLMNRLKAFGIILDGIINLDFKKVGEGFLQAGTGVVDLTGKIKNAGKETSKFFKEAAAKGKEIDDLTKSIEKSENDLILTRAKALKQIKEQELTAKDASKSIAERNKAAQKAIEISNKLSADELAIIDKKIKRKEIENSLNDTSREDEKALNELIASRDKSQEEANSRELSFLGEIASARNAAIAKTEALQKENAEKESLRLKKLSEEKIEAAQFELNEYIRNNYSKLDNDKFFSDESLKIEQKRLDDLAQKQKDFAKTQLDEGVISKQQYDEAIAVIDDENYKAKEENVKARKEAQKEADAIDLENRLAIEEENFANAFELESERLEQQRLRDVEEAEKTGANVTLINEKYAQQQKLIQEQLEAARLATVSDTLGQVSQLLGENTAAGKAAGIAQATINTYQGVTEVWKAPSILPEPFNTATKVAGTAVTLGSGLASVKKIAGVKTPKAERGTLLRGARHSQGGIPIEAEDGEAIINRRSTAMFLPLLSQMNQAGGGVPLMANGGIAGSIKSPASNLIDYNQIALAVSNLPAPIVSVEEITSVNNRVSVIENNSIF
ncbi:hypothetical protein ACFSKN_04775 [Mariniflexile gromovii]|uniref:Uncharacterized protein n=1 Tax=Mariniflexile gromovii TaxID=362523 RepID=A0ABS4BW72_9FLAO|nr:hypothetical protein [Mariniflexile gromovii]MBP0904838.1 hypothetical protein [Mariniflexile gromovii]